MSRQPATVEVGTRLRLDTRQLPARMTDALQQHLTVANPERSKAQRSGRDPDRVPPLVQLFNREGPQLLLPRGALPLLQTQARQHHVPLAWVSHVVSRSTQRVPMDDLHVELRDYQRTAVQALVMGVQGYVKAPCGAGKTIIGASAAICTGEPTLVLVHTHDLLQQWVGLLRSWEYRVRSISGGAKVALRKPLAVENGQPEFAVATVQTLTRAGAAATTLLESAGAVLLDEAHHAPAGTFRSLLERCPARYRWGVTATPKRDDGWDVLLPLVIGPELWSTTMAELVAGGWLMLPRLLPVRSGATLDETAYRSQGGTGRANMAIATNLLAADPDRELLLLRVCTLLAEYGRTVLLLVPRVAQAHRLASLLQAQGVLAMAVTSDVGKGLRRQRLQHLRQRQLQVLVATQLADEGLDVPALDALVVASTGRAAGRAVQRVGRVMRLSPGKGEPLVVDVVDPTPFGSQWQARARAYFSELGIVAPRPQHALELLAELEATLRCSEDAHR